MKHSRIAMGVLLALGIQAQAQAADLLEIYRTAQSQDAVFAAARLEKHMFWVVCCVMLTV
ncbi:MAG: hypothetical protein HZB47_09780 [Nitrosomonadales bacterium]|nr:hypothetical protein [Nitrosomonadales bacterium]